MKVNRIFYYLAIAVVVSSCSVQKSTTPAQLSNIEKFAQDTLFKTAHIGFILIDEKSGKAVETHHADKYFIPASNTKLFTTYASLKHLKDSLPGFYIRETTDSIYIKPNGDPTFLSSAFRDQKMFNKLASSNKALVIEKVSSKSLASFGNGWSWLNFSVAAIAERTVMPMYDNLVKFNVKDNKVSVFPTYFKDSLNISGDLTGKKVNVSRSPKSNTFTATAANNNNLLKAYTLQSDPDLPYHLLQDTLKSLHKKLEIIEPQKRAKSYWKPFYTHKTVDVLRPMMHDSDNYLAEQLLTMVGGELYGFPSDVLAINYVNKNHLSSLSSQFHWADGSGLSRANYVSPRAITELLGLMKKEFGWNKITDILQKGNQGTVEGLYQGYENNIYSKTGTLANNVSSLSGYLTTKKGNKYLFSLMVNGQYKPRVPVRKAFEKFIVNIIENQ